MARSALGKVAWVGRTASMVFGLALVLALLFGAATMALAAVPGDPFRLGQTNGIDTMSTLVGNAAGTMLRVDNHSTGVGATALELRVEAGKPPMKVNSATKVAQLNADKVDGKHATAFYAAGSKVADSSHADTADSAATAQEADHAVTAGSATSADSAADAATLEGKSATDFAAAYKRTVVASPTGTDTENGQALLDTLSGITDASATKPYLLYIEPGTYDLGTRALSMKEHVDIQGGGELRTIITSSVESVCQNGTVVGANNAELRFLTARNTSSSLGCNIAIYNPFGTSSRLTNVTAESTGVGGGLNVGVFSDSESNVTLTNITATASGADHANYAVQNDHNVSMTMTNVTATASGGANRNYGTYIESVDDRHTASMIDVTATASGATQTNYGVQSRSSRVTIRHSKLRGSTNSLYQSVGGGQVALSQLVGPVRSDHDILPLQCFSNYDENLAAVTCP